jgi:hypothetical protein
MMARHLRAVALAIHAAAEFPDGDDVAGGEDVAGGISDGEYLRAWR